MYIDRADRQIKKKGFTDFLVKKKLKVKTLGKSIIIAEVYGLSMKINIYILKVSLNTFKFSIIFNFKIKMKIE